MASYTATRQKLLSCSSSASRNIINEPLHNKKTLNPLELVYYLVLHILHVSRASHGDIIFSSHDKDIRLSMKRQ